MNEVLKKNLKLRLAFLETTWEALAEKSGLKPVNVRRWVRLCNPTTKTLERLSALLGVPTHELLNPDFNPREFPMKGEQP